MIKRLIIFTLTALLASFAYAADKDNTPPELSKWKDWLLENHPDIACSYVASQRNNKRCVWPSSIAININNKGVGFVQEWDVLAESWIPLPGSQQHWPSAVRVDDSELAPLEHNNIPHLRLHPGHYRISGRIDWLQRPQFLQIPVETGLVSLSIDGVAIPWPNIDNNGRLWFKPPETGQAAEGKGDSVQVEVFRRISDDVPLLMQTQIRLTVSGKPRELLMGRLLQDNNEPTRFNSSLPARIEEDGMLRIQVRAGEWVLQINSRLTENVTELTMDKRSDDWPAQEIWSFSHNPQLRGVKISGVPAIDPSQLDLPQGWQELPTFLIDTEATFSIDEQYRGDVSPTANQINNHRTLWLDFDGEGATAKDKLGGIMHQDWRLSAQPSIDLGRVTVDGEPQLVTRLQSDGAHGVEIRNNRLDIEAISRLHAISSLEATGWQHDLDSLSIDLNMPPGWQLWHASGPDTVSTSWLSRWDLWDLFLCLLIVGATSKLLGWRWAALATVMFALVYHEANAPLISWLVLIFVLPLLQVLPHGRFRRMITSLGYLTLAGLAIIIINFSVQQIQRAMYPQLEQSRAINTQAGRYDKFGSVAEVDDRSYEIAIEPEDRVRGEVVVTAQKREPEQLFQYAKQALSDSDATTKRRYQPSANIQTGPGEPTWQWNRARLNWSGPVKADETLELYLSPPWLTRLLKFLHVVLVCGLSFAFARTLFNNIRSRPRGNGDSDAPALMTAVLLMCALPLFKPTDAMAQEYPPQYLLQEMEQRLIKPPECLPTCLAMNAVQVTVSGDLLRIRLRVGVDTALAVPIPFDRTWQAKQISVDGETARGIAKTGNRLWVNIAKGDHEIILEGLVNGDSINIPFLQNPHNISVTAEGWEVFGLVDNRLPSRSLQLQKRERSAARDALLPAPIAPFVKITRRVDMDLDWNVITTVRRMAPQQGGITINIPLLENESVVNEDIKIVEENGKSVVVATLGVRQNSISWNSVLQPDKSLKLIAASNPLYVEIWSVNSSPRWHISHAGLLPVKAATNESGAVPRWLPWPGEEVQINAVQPEPVAGPTVTVESVLVDTKPGNRSSEVDLTLAIRSSLGGDFRIQQPEGAALERIEIDGEETTKQLEGNTVIIPLHPGLQTASLHWSLPIGVGFGTQSPVITLSEPANNIDITMAIPPSRWPLLVTGPDIGPAMLYWGVLLVILIIAFALGKMGKRFALDIPVNTWQWLLLTVGMSTVNMIGSIPVVLWFFIMQARAKLPMTSTRWKFNSIQFLLGLFTLVAIVSLFATIPESLLSTPDMKVTGNGSYNYLYRWYQDNSPELLPMGQVFSIPIWAYRITMLAWSLWIVFALLRWSQWGWGCFSKDRLWIGKIIESSKVET